MHIHIRHKYIIYIYTIPPRPSHKLVGKHKGKYAMRYHYASSYFHFESCYESEKKPFNYANEFDNRPLEPRKFWSLSKVSVSTNDSLGEGA